MESQQGVYEERQVFWDPESTCKQSDGQRMRHERRPILCFTNEQGPLRNMIHSRILKRTERKTFNGLGLPPRNHNILQRT